MNTRFEKLLYVVCAIGFIGMLLTPESEDYWYIWLTAFFILFLVGFLGMLLYSFIK